MITFYSDNVDGAYKIKMLPVVVISKKHKNDIGLHKHEQEHVKQYLVCFAATAIPLFILTNWFIALIVGIMAHDMLYTLVKKYRLWSEVKAFRKQLSYGGSVDIAAKHLSNDYDLGITFEEAKKLLS